MTNLVEFKNSMLSIPNFNNEKLNELTTVIVENNKEIAGGYYNIADALNKIDKNPSILTDDGFENVVDYGERVFGYKKTTVYNFIILAERFSNDEFNKYGASVLRATNCLPADTAKQVVAERFTEDTTAREAVDIVKEIKNNNVIDVEYKEVETYKYDHTIEYADWFEIYDKGQPEMPVKPETDDEDELADYEDTLADYEDTLAEYNKSVEIVKNNQALYDAASKSKPVKPVKKGMNPDEYNAKLEQYNQDVVEYEKAKAICDEYMADRAKYKKAKKAEDKKRSAKLQKEYAKRIAEIEKLSEQLNPNFTETIDKINAIWCADDLKIMASDRVQLHSKLEKVVFDNLINSIELYHRVFKEKSESAVMDLLRTLKPQDVEMSELTDSKIETNE